MSMKFVTCTIIISLVINAVSQDYSNIQFERYSIEDGLSSTQISRVYQDSEGFIWAATRGEGVNRYDGNKFVSFNNDKTDSTTIGSININEIFEDSRKQLWFGGSTGLSLYLREKEEFITFSPDVNLKGARGNNIKKIFEDSDGRLWYGSSSGLLEILQDSININKLRFKNYPYNHNGEKKIIGIVVTISEDYNGRLWIGTRRGLFIFDRTTEKFQPVNHLVLKTINIEDLKVRGNCMWIATSDGAYRLLLNDKCYTSPDVDFFLNTDENFRNGIFSDISVVTSLGFDKDSTLWLCTESGIVIIKNPFEKEIKKQDIFRYKHLWFDDKSLSHNEALWITFDKNYIAWIGTRKGISKYDRYRYKFETFIRKEGQENTMSHESVSGIAENKTGDVLAILYRNGVDFYLKNSKEFIKAPRINTKNGYLNSLSNYGNNSFLAAAVIQRKPAIIHIELPDKLTKENVHQIKYSYYDESDIEEFNQRGFGNVVFQASNNELFFGTSGGAFIIKSLNSNTGTKLNPVRQLVPELEMANDACYTIIEDKNSNIWLGYNAHLIRYNLETEKAETIELTTDFNVNGIYGVHVDNQNDSIVWIGTKTLGLFSFDLKNDSYERYTSNEGLSANRVFSILEDKSNNLWFSTNKGLCKFDKNLKQVTSFGLKDGIQGFQYLRSSAFQNEKGEMYFGGTNGFNFFDPIKAGTVNNFKPPVKITSLKINNETVKIGDYIFGKKILTNSVSHTKEIKIFPKMRKITFEFAALSYSSSHKNLFKYKLENYEDEWNETNIYQPYASYNNLNGGEYVFKVKAANCDNVWNEEPASIKVIVQPPFYKTLGFRVSVIFILAISVFIFVRIRIKRLKKQKDLLEEKVEERTKDLKLANLELKEQKEEIVAQNEEIQQQSEEITAQRDALEDKNKEVLKSYQRLELLSDFGQRLTASLSIDAINEMMYNYVRNIINFQAFGIGIVDNTRNTIIYPNFIEGGNKLPAFEKSLTDVNSLTTWCIVHQKPIFINDIENEFQKYVPKLNVSTTKQLSHSRLHLPLTVQDKKIGILVINSYEKNAYSNDDFTNMQTLASYISIALDNAQAYEQINDKNRAIKESINYAKSIQNAFMPTQEQLDRYLDCFVIFKPKDIVSGDFTWFSPLEKDETKPLNAFICVADCTGHGVPGALVSMIGNNLLDKYINEKHITNPAQVLEMVNVGFQLALKQDETRNNDGMDMALVLLEENGNEQEHESESGVRKTQDLPASPSPELQRSEAGSHSNSKLNAQLDQDNAKPNSRNIKLTFAGAKNPCIIYRAETGELEVLKGSRKSIGGLRAKRSKQYYENTETTVNKGDVIYLFTDGIIDQHDAKRDRYTRNRLMKLLKEIGKESISSQKEKIITELKSHTLNEKQTDDISLIGIKV